MALLDRLSGASGGKLPVHQFWGALVEWIEGEITRADVIAAFDLTADDEVELDWLKGKIDASANKPNFMHHIHSLFMLAEGNLFGYEVKATMQARILGLA